MIEFICKEKYETETHTFYWGENPSECNDFNHITNQIVLIDGVARKISHVEKYALPMPYPKGTMMSLVVSK